VWLYAYQDYIYTFELHSRKAFAERSEKPRLIIPDQLFKKAFKSTFPTKPIPIKPRGGYRLAETQALVYRFAKDLPQGSSWVMYLDNLFTLKPLAILRLVLQCRTMDEATIRGILSQYGTVDAAMIRGVLSRINGMLVQIRNDDRHTFDRARQLGQESQALREKYQQTGSMEILNESIRKAELALGPIRQTMLIYRTLAPRLPHDMNRRAKRNTSGRSSVSPADANWTWVPC
jgi:hypothetical protein